MMTEATKNRLDDMLKDMARAAGLSEDEWTLLQDVTSGTCLLDETVVRNLHAEVEDAEECLFEKRGMDRQAILTKLSKLDSLSRLAMVHRLDRLRS